MNSKKNLIKDILTCLLAVLIPALLAVNSIQARNFAVVDNEIKMLELKQAALIESNKELIAGISVLSSTDRIEKIASEQLGMRLAESNEIIRVEMKGLGGAEQ